MMGFGFTQFELWKWGLLLWAALHVPMAAATDSQARRQVREGVEKHRAGNFAEAETAFTKAAQQMPQTPLILFDQACALTAQGKFDEAESLFEQVRLRADPELAAASLYNLGGIAAQRANAILGEKPEDATVETRQKGLTHLEQAVNRYRQCLALDPSHSEARHNLELLRVWIKNMQNIWQEKDRQKRRDQLALLEFLEMLEKEQQALRTSTQEAGSVPDSPKRRRSISELANRQRRLQEEIQPLQAKIKAWPSESQKTDPSASANSAPAPADPQLDKVIQMLVGTAQEAGKAMSQAAIDLAANSPGSAPSPQTQALAKLDEIYRVAAPFERLLQNAIRVEEKQVEATRAMQASQDSDQRAGPAQDSIVETQQKIVGWIASLTQKAETLLEQLPDPPMPQPASTDNAESPDEKTAGNTDAPPAETGRSDDAQAMRDAYTRAMELGPQAAKIATEAASDAAAGKWDLATTKEEQVVELLKKILEELPQPPEQPQENEDSKKQEKKQPSGGEKDQQEQNKPQDEGNSQQQEKKEDNDQKQDSSEPPSNKESDLDRRQAEALLRQVRQREREYKERQKEIQAILRGVVPVDKDW